MSLPELQKSYFQLFDLPENFALDQAQLGERYRELQKELHPDRYASGSAHEQRLAVQYSALINEAYATLRKALPRALYLLKLAGMSKEDISGQKVDGSFLMAQMDLRENLMMLDETGDPEAALEHFVTEIDVDVKQLHREFSRAFSAGELTSAAGACVKLQYLEKLLEEAEQMESRLIDNQN
jgi:molecular chaperone HscB